MRRLQQAVGSIAVPLAKSARRAHLFPAAVNDLHSFVAYYSHTHGRSSSQLEAWEAASQPISCVADAMACVAGTHVAYRSANGHLVRGRLGLLGAEREGAKAVYAEVCRSCDGQSPRMSLYGGSDEFYVLHAEKLGL